ncbi:uncharacterized protein LOC132628375 [Lycium barbarum]|uniref:uncharacterized protein LOC132628375 n=1 Tax=Lycium barbarum TaxID=112863 RepID=UPI00293F6CB0|nr:uncharacterized protein LOC132628375 [Lycium barbarum]
MEYLNRNLKGLADNKKFHFHPRCSKLRITYLCFADDLLLFARGDLDSITIMNNCFKEFSMAFGLQANLGKNSVYCGDMTQNDQDRINHHLGFGFGEFPFKYLGIPLSKKKLTLIQWQPLIDKILARITYWIAKKLSYAGRTQLIQFVLFGQTLDQMGAHFIKRRHMSNMTTPTQAYWMIRRILGTRTAMLQMQLDNNNKKSLIRQIYLVLNLE